MPPKKKDKSKALQKKEADIQNKISNTINVVFSYGGQVETNAAGLLSYLNGETKITVWDLNAPYEDFMVMLEDMTKASRDRFFIQAVINDIPRNIQCKDEYDKLMKGIIAAKNLYVMGVWVVGDLDLGKGNKKETANKMVNLGVKRNLFAETTSQSSQTDWGNQPNFSRFHTPVKKGQIPSQYILDPASPEKTHCVLAKGDGNEQHPLQIIDTPPPGRIEKVDLTTPPPAPSRAPPAPSRAPPATYCAPPDSVVRLGDGDKDVYRPLFEPSNYCEIPAKHSDKPAKVITQPSTHQEERSNSQDVAAILSEMRKNNGFWEGFSIEVEEYGVLQEQLEAEGAIQTEPQEDGEGCSRDEDSDGTYIDSEVDVHDSPLAWTTEDELEAIAYDDSLPVLGSTELNTQEREVEAELFGSDNPIGLDNMPLDLSASLDGLTQQLEASSPLGLEDIPSGLAGISCNLEDRFGHASGSHSVPQDEENAPSHGTVPSQVNTPHQHIHGNTQYRENTPQHANFATEQTVRHQRHYPSVSARDFDDEVKQELNYIYENLSRINRGCAPHTEPLHNMYLTPKLGQVYLSRDDFMRDMKTFAIEKEFDINKCKTEMKRVFWKCKVPTCTWYVRAIPNVNGTWQISKMVDTHTCGKFRLGSHNRQADSDWMAHQVKRKLRDNSDITTKQLMDQIEEQFQTKVSRKIAWKAKEKALSTLRGSFSESYQLLETYFNELKLVDPDSQSEIVTGPGDEFQCMFWSYGITVRAYKKTLRPVIIIDGTFLKGRYPGVVLSAIAIEGNNHVFPLAFSLVQKENNDNWEWFLTKLRDHVVGPDHEFVILSDRHKSIIQAIPKLLPKACHMYCAQHMSVKYGNAKVRWLLKEAAKTLNQSQFWGYMLQIWAISQKAYHSLMSIGPLNKWASAFQEKSRYGIVYTNHVESWNKMIIPERMLPATALLEGIHANIMEHHRDYRADSEKFKTPVTSWCHEQILHCVWRGRTFTREMMSASIWTIYGEGRTCVVDLDARQCTCKWWQVMGIPCEHAMCVIRDAQLDPYQYCSVYYKNETYKETYKENWRPTRGKDEWPKDRVSRKILPPTSTIMPGRPKKKRRRSKLEGVPVQLRRCTRCRLPGHNKSTCIEVIPDYQYVFQPLPDDLPPDF